MTNATTLPLQPADAGMLSGWRRTAMLSVLFMVSAFCQVDRILPFILAESIKKELHLSDTQLGLITGIAFAVCYSLASLPLARFADRGAAKQVLLWCIIIWSAMTGLGGLATGFVTLTVSRFGVALGEAGGTPASHALIAAKIPERLRGMAIGLFAMGVPLGTMFGFALGGWANDHIGWRYTLFAAGAIGLFIALLSMRFLERNTMQKQASAIGENFWASARKLLAKPAFKWMFITANIMGFAAAPFYAFSAPFLIRVHGFTASQAGLAFGLLQGAMGIVGTLVGGRRFDNAVKQGNNSLLGPPGILFCITSITTLAALFVPEGWMAVALFVPGMLSFAFLLPYAFGAGHLVAGQGKQALSSGMLMLGTGLLGPTLSPLLVGLLSDTVTAMNMPHGLRWGLLVVPVANLLSGLACLVTGSRIKEYLDSRDKLTKQGGAANKFIINN